VDGEEDQKDELNDQVECTTLDDVDCLFLSGSTRRAGHTPCVERATRRLRVAMKPSRTRLCIAGERSPRDPMAPRRLGQLAKIGPQQCVCDYPDACCDAPLISIVVSILGSKRRCQYRVPNPQRETRKDDDPVIPGQEQPAAVCEDKFTEEFRKRDNDVSADEDTCLFCEPMNTRRGPVACEVLECAQRRCKI
jgi:hypothetical protein